MRENRGNSVLPFEVKKREFPKKEATPLTLKPKNNPVRVKSFPKVGSKNGFTFWLTAKEGNL